MRKTNFAASCLVQKAPTGSALFEQGVTIHPWW
jgi:hypothetical protein